MSSKRMRSRAVWKDLLRKMNGSIVRVAERAAHFVLENLPENDSGNVEKRDLFQDLRFDSKIQLTVQAEFSAAAERERAGRDSEVIGFDFFIFDFERGFS